MNKSKVWLLFSVWFAYRLSRFPLQNLQKSTLLKDDFAISGCFTVRVKRTEFAFKIEVGPGQRGMGSH